MGYTLFNAFLPQYLSANSSDYITYRNYAITESLDRDRSFLLKTIPCM